MNKWHTWYKALVGLGSVLTIYFVLYMFLNLESEYYRFGYTVSDLLGDIRNLIIGDIIIWTLFHFIVYKGIYLHYYKKQQKQNIINEITALTLLKEQGIVSQDEYLSKVDGLKNELLGL